jgi:hypothetical protein
MRLFLPRRLAILPAFALAACSDSTDPGPITTPTGQITVDAATTTAYVRLGATAQSVSVADPSTSGAWDLGFNATTVSTNGGSAGPGGVFVHCLCGNASATTAQLQAFTPDNQLAAFEAVTSASVPAESQFSADALNPGVSSWFTGSGATATVTPNRSFILRQGTTTVILAKVRVTTIANAGAQNAGVVTVEYATQSTPGGAFGTVQTKAIDVRNGAVYLDLATGTTGTTAIAGWDLLFSGWSIRSNGGVSGTGGVSVLADATTTFAQIDAVYAGAPPAQAFRTDGFTGVFGTQVWYKYNITGTDNQIWPTFNVYLVKRGNEVYKVQLTGYYGAAGNARQITIRYARVQ